MKKIIIQCCRWLLRVVVFITIMMFILAIWVKNAPPQLSAFYPQIEKELNRLSPEYRFEFQSITLVWPSYHFVPGIQLSDFKCVRTDGVFVGQCPKAILKFSLLRLLTGRFALSGAAMYNPRLILPATAPSLPSPAPAVNAPLPAENRLSGAEEFQQRLSHIVTDARSVLHHIPAIRKIILINAVIEHPAIGKSLNIQRAKLTIHRRFKGVKLTLEADCRINKQPYGIDLRIFAPWKSGPATLMLHIPRFHPGSLAKAFPFLAFLEGIDLPVSARIDGVVSSDGCVADLDFSLDGQNGVLNPPGIWEEALPVRRIRLKGSLHSPQPSLTLNTLLIDFGGPVFHFDGQIGNLLHPLDDLLVNLRMEKLKLTEAPRYWPYRLVPVTREWFHHFYDGYIREATAQFKLTPGDLEKEILPRDAVTAVVPFENITLDYYRPLPLVTQVSGVGRFSAHDILIKTTGANVAESVVKNGHVDITGMAEKGHTMIDIGADVHGPPDDLRNAIDLLIGRKKESVIVNAGEAKTRLTFRFSLSNFEKHPFEYTARSDMRDLEIQDFMGYRYSQKKLHAELKQNDLSFRGSGGRLTHPRYLKQPVQIKKIKSRMKLLTQAKKGGITFSGFQADLGGPLLSGKGSVIKGPKAYPSVRLNLRADQLNADHLPRYWPENLASGTRKWLKNHILGGQISGAHINIRLSPNDFNASHLPDKAVNIEVPFSRLEVDYFPPLPRAEALNGTALISASGFSAAIESGKTLNTTITSGTVSIADWRPKHPMLEISAACQGPATDLLDASETLPSSSGHSLDGSVQNGSAATDISLKLPLFTDDVDVTYRIRSQIENLAISDFYGFKLTDGKLLMTATKKGINAEGALMTGDTQVNLKWRKEKNAPEWLALNTSVDAARLPDLHLPRLPFVDGTIEARAELLLIPGKMTLKSVLDMQKTGIRFSALGWQKPAGDPASLQIQTLFSDDGVFSFPSIRMTGEDLNFEGKGRIQKIADSPLSYDFSLDQVHFGETRLALQASGSDKSIHRMTLSGATLDLSQMSFSDALSAPDQKRDKTPKPEPEHKKASPCNADISARFDRVLLKNNETLTDVRTRAACRESRLISADLDGLLAAGKHLRFSVVPSGKRSKCHLRSDDAGRLFRGLGLSDHINSGTLDLRAEFEKPLPANGPAKGALSLQNYSLTQGPVLMNILSLASFVGILEQMKSGGVDFSQMKADLSYDGRRLKILNGRMEGLALGMTASGTYDIPGSHLKIEGIVVPFNMLNKLIGFIPIVGKLITGDGIIATRYSVTGSPQEPDINIKPLSTLSVGFLKGVFDQLQFQPISEKGKDSTDKTVPPSPHQSQEIK